MQSNQIDGGVIIFQFKGGPRDGQLVRSDVPTDKDSTSEAVTFWAMTKGGRLRSSFVTSPGGPLSDLITGGIQLDGSSRSAAKHRYRIIDRIEEAKEIRLIAEYVEPQES